MIINHFQRKNKTRLSIKATKIPGPRKSVDQNHLVFDLPPNKDTQKGLVGGPSFKKKRQLNLPFLPTPQKNWWDFLLPSLETDTFFRHPFPKSTLACPKPVAEMSLTSLGQSSFLPSSCLQSSSLQSSCL